MGKKPGARSQKPEDGSYSSYGDDYRSFVYPRLPENAYRGCAWLRYSGFASRLLTLGYQYDPAEPATTWTPEAFLIGDATCAKLARWVRAASGELRLEPEVGVALPAISADGRTYSFKIRPGFAFSDLSAEKVTAETFRYSIERALSPKLGEMTPGRLFLGDIEGEDAFRRGSAAHISGLVADGDRLSITLIPPRGDLTSQLAPPLLLPGTSRHPVLVGCRAREGQRS